MEARVMEQFNYWLNDPYFDDATKQELLAIRNDPKEVEDRFYKDLAFGTGRRDLPTISIRTATRRRESRSPMTAAA